MDDTDRSIPGSGSRSRPVLVDGYGVDQAATSEMLTWAHVRDQMTEARNYWIATVRPGGGPHVMPVWGIWLDESFMFSTDPSSRKARNFGANPGAVVHLESGDDVVVIEGSIERVGDRPLLVQFAERYLAKYAIGVEVDNPAYGIYRLRASRVFAWQEQDFPSTATKWEFRPVG